MNQCKRCDKPFMPKNVNHVYCSTECREPEGHNRCRGLDKDVPPGTIGAIAELAVAADLMSNGYQVFRSLSPHSFCDLIAIKGGETRKIEVRSGTYNYKGDLFYNKVAKPGAEEFAVYVHDVKSVLYISIAGVR